MFRFFAGLLAGVTLLLTPAFCSAPQPTPIRYDGGAPRLEVAHATNTRNDYFINLDTVKKVVCLSFPAGVSIESDPEKLTEAQIRQVHEGSGSGTVIAKNRVLTAHHVIAGMSACLIDGRLAKPVYDDADLDMTVLEVPLGDTAVAQTSCDGFDKSRPYFMIGYAWSRDFALQHSTFTGVYDDIMAGEGDGTNEHLLRHIAEFNGAVFPGMSGGPVIGTDGRVYGLINAGDEHQAAFRDLKDTPLCAALAVQPPPHLIFLDPALLPPIPTAKP
jgi:S1-C subfamily serine protease